jgi:hypothetical protein
MPQHEDLQFLERRGRPSRHMSASRFRATRYINDQSKQPSLGHDHDQPNPASTQQSHGRVREPYGLWRQLSDVYPGYDTYAQKTSRRIPVIVLEPARSPDERAEPEHDSVVAKKVRARGRLLL